MQRQTPTWYLPSWYLPHHIKYYSSKIYTRILWSTKPRYGIYQQGIYHITKDITIVKYALAYYETSIKNTKFCVISQSSPPDKIIINEFMQTIEHFVCIISWSVHLDFLYIQYADITCDLFLSAKNLNIAKYFNMNSFCDWSRRVKLTLSGYFVKEFGM